MAEGANEGFEMMRKVEKDEEGRGRKTKEEELRGSKGESRVKEFEES